MKPVTPVPTWLPCTERDDDALKLPRSVLEMVCKEIVVSTGGSFRWAWGALGTMAVLVPDPQQSTHPSLDQHQRKRDPRRRFLPHPSSTPSWDSGPSPPRCWSQIRTAFAESGRCHGEVVDSGCRTTGPWQLPDRAQGLVYVRHCHNSGNPMVHGPCRWPN
jgi:hypothetical protein